MKKLVLIIVLALLCTGCVKRHKPNAIDLLIDVDQAVSLSEALSSKVRLDCIPFVSPRVEIVILCNVYDRTKGQQTKVMLMVSEILFPEQEALLYAMNKIGVIDYGDGQGSFPTLPTDPNFFAGSYRDVRPTASLWGFFRSEQKDESVDPDLVRFLETVLR